jgi:hypothetical protein
VITYHPPVESRGDAVAGAPFSPPAHQTGQADFPHPASGQAPPELPGFITTTGLSAIPNGQACSSQSFCCRSHADTAGTAGASRVACRFLLRTCRRHYPGGTLGSHLSVLPRRGQEAHSPRASGWSDQFAGWDSPPLETTRLSRHTESSGLMSRARSRSPA